MKILIGIGVIMLLLIILIVALPFLIDLNKYQDRYRPLIEEALNRKVELKDIRLTIWPRIGARIGGFIVQDDPAFRAGPFASLSSLDVGVKLLPLLGGQVDVEEITLRDPVITVLKNAQGQLNVSTLGAKPQVSAPKPDVPGQPAEQSAPSPGPLCCGSSLDRRRQTDLSRRIGFETDGVHRQRLGVSSHVSPSRRESARTSRRNRTTLQPSDATRRVLRPPRGNPRPEIIQLQP